ncbi:MAG: c-type cytochrome [Bacteroidota bacterium]
MKKQIFYPILFIFLGVYACQQQVKEQSTPNQLAEGQQVYQTNCQSCHQAEGQGIPSTHPPLQRTAWVTGSKERLINIVLQGLQEEIRVHGELYDEVMPAMPYLTDQQVSDVLTYVRHRFGAGSSGISVAEVTKVRKGESLNEPRADFVDVKPKNDYSQRKIKNGVSSRVGSTYADRQVLLDEIKLPAGFKIDIFAKGLKNPRSLALGPKGTIFVGARKTKPDFFYALTDKDGDWKADTIIKITKGLEWRPLGVAMRGDNLYVGEIHRILRYRNIESLLDNPPAPEVIFEYPREKKHGDKYIQFGPDGKLYVPVGAPCNNCLEDNPIFASITRMNPDGSDFEIFAHGVRNSRGYAWHPKTCELWFTDNGRDHLGDDIPPCEVNIAAQAGKHYGYPFCHGNGITDPEFGSQRPCSDFVPTTFDLVAHAAPVSLKFYTGEQFPEDYRNNIFISEHGSWNRAEKQGYRVMRLILEGNKVVRYEPFAVGWLNSDKNDAWGRPVDMLQMPDGSLLLSDDYAGVIYRISYDGVNI